MKINAHSPTQYCIVGENLLQHCVFLKISWAQVVQVHTPMRLFPLLLLFHCDSLSLSWIFQFKLTVEV